MFNFTQPSRSRSTDPRRSTAPGTWWSSASTSNRFSLLDGPVCFGARGRHRAHLFRGHSNDHGPWRYVLSDDRARAHYCSIADFDTALVLEPAAAVDEHVLTKPDVLAKVGTEWREELERPGGLAPSQFAEQRPNLIGGVVAPVELGCDAQRLLARACIAARCGEPPRTVSPAFRAVRRSSSPSI